MTHGAFFYNNKRNAENDNEPLGSLLSFALDKKNQEMTMNLLIRRHLLH
jgi:hypothetical protein